MTEDMVQVSFDNGETIGLKKGTTFKEVVKHSGIDFVFRPVAVKSHNRLYALSDKIENDVSVTFVDASVEEGRRVYRSSLTMMMLKAFYKLFPNGTLTVNHSVMGGVWCTPEIGETFKTSHLHLLEEEMARLVEQKIPFVTQAMDATDVIEIFKNRNRPDLIALLEDADPGAQIDVSDCGDYKDCMFMKLVPHTGYLGVFSFFYYPPGFILRFPKSLNPNELASHFMERQIFKVYTEFKKWVHLLDAGDVASLNDVIRRGEINDIIRISEAFHEKKIAAIADAIYLQKENLRVILIAGPSSSGKTTFAHRLSVQLRVNGMKPVSISVDDYFLNREFTPRDEKGDYNFEVIEALDLELFNEHLAELLAGKEVTIPIFDFTQGRRMENGKKLKITTNQPIIIEGIHALNDKLTESVARENKFKIYLSPLTQMRLDNHNRIHTTDTRILRRLVRDNLYRGRDAVGTLERWDSVRRGERGYIFPFQEEADLMFNSFLIYEIAVLKNFLIEPLQAIKDDRPEFSEAQRLLQMLQFFLKVGTDEIPPNSILREFIGATCFIKTEV